MAKRWRTIRRGIGLTLDMYVDRQGRLRCDVCRKVAYEREEAATRAARVRGYSVYRSGRCRFFHLTSKPLPSPAIGRS